MESTTWIFFSQTGIGYEIKGSDVMSAFSAFQNVEKTYTIEYSFSELKDDMHFFVYEWDKSQKREKLVYEEYKREYILIAFARNVDIPDYLKSAIVSKYHIEVN